MNLPTAMPHLRLVRNSHHMDRLLVIPERKPFREARLRIVGPARATFGGAQGQLWQAMAAGAVGIG